MNNLIPGSALTTMEERKLILPLSVLWGRVAPNPLPMEQSGIFAPRYHRTAHVLLVGTL